MHVLVLNAGSSSLKAAIFDGRDARRLASVALERCHASGTTDEPGVALAQALRSLETQAPAAFATLGAVGHRIVHGGAMHHRPAQVDAAVEAEIEACGALAPLHNPPALAVLRAARARFGSLPQVAVFDTAFHSTLPEAAWRYALPRTLTDPHRLRRYGFHGISHASVMRRCAAALGRPAGELRLISAHLGAGGSVAAIDRGRSVDTSMGLTPLEGLVMGTRAGDLDPGLLLHLQREARLSPAGMEELLNRGSGLLALAGTADMAQIERRAAAGEVDCALTIEIYVHRLRRYLGAMAVVLGGVDAIAFTGGIGEHSARVREGACARLGFLGAQLDAARNALATVTHGDPVATISLPDSAVRLLVIAADEERAIAEEVETVISGRSGSEWAS